MDDGALFGNSHSRTDEPVLWAKLLLPQMEGVF